MSENKELTPIKVDNNGNEIVEIIKTAIQNNIDGASHSPPELLHCYAEYLNALLGAYRTFN